MSLTIDLPRAVDGDLAADIEKESAYLRRLSVVRDGGAVELEVADGGQPADVEAKVKRFLDAMLKHKSGFDTKVFLTNERRDDGPLLTAVHAQLVERGWIYDYGNGHVALSGPVLALSRLVDAKAAELYQRHFGAKLRAFPAFVDLELLKRCGYIDSHPNALSFVGNVVEDFDAIEEFRQANNCAEGSVLPPEQHMHHSGLCLNPAACFPCYPTLSNQRIDGQAVTWQGRVFRYESRNVAGLDRLWEFNVRELVFVGSEDYVNDCRRAALPLIIELAAHLDLDCMIETATDPFFATVSVAKKFWQQAQEVKNEIMMPIDAGMNGTPRRIACGSINLHGSFFGDRFDIAAGTDEAAFTGCIGLGIERWVLAGFAQHGLAPERWPAAVRNVIFD